MGKINWCKRKDGGIRLVEPNTNLCDEYYRNSEESLKVLKSIAQTQSRVWLATTKYYIEYFAVYSVFMKIGVKCEIHDCTIELAKFLENESVFENGIAAVLENDKDLRIDNQYYLKNRPVNIDFNQLSGFLLAIRRALDNLSSAKIEDIRKKIAAI
ncbi:MAG: hypothetical protein V1839_00200 [archaeon]